MKIACLGQMTICIVLLVFTGRAKATDLFGVDVTYSGGTINQSARSLPDLIDALVNNQNNFSPLTGNDFSANVTYFGLPDTMTIDVTGDTQLTISSSLTGLNKTFTGSDRADLENQLKDWLLKYGSDEVAKLLRAVAERSTAALIDGNPASATARMSDRAFRTFSFFNASPAMRGSIGRGTHSGLWFSFANSKADTPAGTIKTSESEINLRWWKHLSKSISLIGNMVGQYRDTEGTAIYGVGGDLGLGIRLVPRAADERFGWQLTPFTGLYGVGSYDGATGGLLNHFGISNRFEFRCFKELTLVFASQYAYYDSLKLEVDNVKIDPKLKQQVVKNGLLLDIPVVNKMYLNASIIDTRFLKNVVIDSYQTLGTGLSFRGEKLSFNLNVNYEVADKFDGWNAFMGLSWRH